MYEKSNVNKISSFEKAQDETDAETLLKMLRERFDDSLYINTEY
jgi:thiamine pyrophosphokinase